eukprot:COSAG06_NODE_55655_length_288_cov_1.126984_1_plen_57_part_10
MVRWQWQRLSTRAADRAGWSLPPSVEVPRDVTGVGCLEVVHTQVGVVGAAVLLADAV